MNAHPKFTLTAGESALVEAYAERIGRLPGNAERVAARDQALSQLKQQGLPTRKVEAWHYTDLRRLLTDAPAYRADIAAGSVDALVPGSVVVETVNGKTHPLPSIEGVGMQLVSDLLHAEVGGLPVSEMRDYDAIGLINTVFVSGGTEMRIDEGVELDAPIELQSVHEGGQVHTRNVVTAGANSSAMIIDRHFGSDDDVLVTNVTDISLQAGASVRWILVQDQGMEASHLGQINVELAEGAQLTLFIVNASGKLVRQELHAKVMGEGADLTFRSVNMLGEKSHCDVTLELDHLVPNTTSSEVVRNVVTDRAQGVFQGQIRVAQAAQKTDAQMACNTLLLSDEAGYSVKPELEIFADDVICAHGATVAEIDEDHLFYLMARGISKKVARGLLIKAFVAEIIEELEDEVLVEALEDRMDQWLEAHG